MHAHSGLVGISTPRENMQAKGEYDRLDLITFLIWPWALVRYTRGWTDRGWTFQEGYFSQRRLVFTNKQVIFDCNEGVISEDLPHTQIQYDRMLAKWSPDLDETMIYALVQIYSERELTYDADMLNAFDGVLGDFEQREPPVRSYWGIPLLFNTSGYLDEMLFGLCWNHTLQDGKPNRRPGFPSWSWAGWRHGPYAEYYLRRKHDTDLVVPHDTCVLVEKQDGFVEVWNHFEEADPDSTRRSNYSQRIHLSAPCVRVLLRKNTVSMVHRGERLHGYSASVLKDAEGGYWPHEAGLDSQFESLELSHNTQTFEEARTCYAIHLFSAAEMKDRHGVPVANVFALLLVAKLGTNWERVGLWQSVFSLKENARRFEGWLQGSSTYEMRDFWIH